MKYYNYKTSPNVKNLTLETEFVNYLCQYFCINNQECSSYKASDESFAFSFNNGEISFKMNDYELLEIVANKTENSELFFSEKLVDIYKAEVDKRIRDLGYKHYGIKYALTYKNYETEKLDNELLRMVKNYEKDLNNDQGMEMKK